MKLLHCADIHLGRRPVGGVGDFSNKRYNDYFAAFAWAIDTAIAEHVRVVLIAGDLFDRKELMPEVLERTEALLEMLRHARISVLLTEGNHDNITPGKEDDSWIVYLANKGLLQRPAYSAGEDGYHFSPVDIDGYRFYGVGYPGGYVNETLAALADHLAAAPDGRNIVLVHTAVASGDFLPGTVDKKTIELFRDKALYLAGGHFHSYQAGAKDGPQLYIPGSLEYWDLGEPAGRKGVIIFDTDDRAHRFIPSRPRKKTAMKLDIGSDSNADVLAEFAAAVDAACFDEQEEIVFVELRLAQPFYVDTQACEDLLQKKGALKAFVRVSYPGRDAGDHRARQLVSAEEVERELIAGWELFSAKADETARVLARLKEHQKGGNREQFLETFDGMLEMVMSGNGAGRED